ncbi:MAG: Zn-dependent alcohol dehydrogenase [Deltaproteobacteria bacterium]|nr:Zn-dependent alcohol dehydrogenase [Deltaproteobacteria bacterium]
MKAAVLRGIKQPLSIEDIQIAKPGPREVLVRTVAAGVCHSDLHFWTGAYQYPMPAVLGHESAGVVEQVGSDVRYVAPGDHVITCLSVFCGSCEYCLSGRPSLCDKAATRRPFTDPPRLSKDGAPVWQFLDLSSYAEQMLVHENAIVKIRKDMPLDRAALIGCGVTTGVGAVFNTAKVAPGSTVAVIGCGGVGLSAIQGAAIAGAGRVIAVDMLDSKLELARKMGATDAVNAKKGDPVAQVKDLTGGGVDYSFEAIGLKIAAEQAFGMLKNGGTATVIGMIPIGQKVELPGVDFLFEKKIQGSNMGSNRFRTDMPKYVDMYLNGKLNLDDLVSRRIKLEDVNEAFAQLETGEVARSVIMMS